MAHNLAFIEAAQDFKVAIASHYTHEWKQQAAQSRWGEEEEKIVIKYVKAT